MNGKHPPSTQPRRWRRLAYVVLLLLLALVSVCPVWTWDRWPRIRIVGQLVDAATDEPVRGVTLIPLSDASIADDEERLEEIRSYAEEWSGAEEIERTAAYGSPFFSLDTGLGRSDPDGRFDLCTTTAHGGQDNIFGCSLGPSAPPPFNGVRALLLEWPDGRRQVLDTTLGQYRVVNDAGIYAMIDMGVVRVDSE